MKRIISVLLVVTLILVSLVGCGGKDKVSDSKGESYSFRMATHYPVTHPGYAALETIVADISDKTDGKVEIKIYPSSQLGDYTLTYEDLMRGSIDMALIPIPSQYEPKLEMNFIPFMVTDYSQMEKAFGPESYFMKEYGAVHEGLGVKLLGIYVEGLIGMGFTDLPDNYNDANAQKGLQVRCPAIEVYNLITQDMGFSATTIPYADLYTALQTGVVDGWIGGTPQLNYTDFKDVIKYYVPYNVFAENIGFFMSQQVYDTVPAEYQEIINNAFMKESINSYEVAQQLDEEAMQNLRDYGVEILELTHEEMQAYIKIAQEKTWPKLYDNIGEETLNNLVKALE